MDRLYDKLMEYSKNGDYPMHMPGHKRNTKLCSMMNPYAIDITEIDGFDNLHQPEGVLLSLSQRISHLFKAEYSYPLVNGSTAGILAGISAALNRGDQILIARNSHKSVYHGVILMDLNPVYCYPQFIEDFGIYGGILPENIEEALISNPKIKLVVITSPTYEGIVSDIKKIAEVTHRHGAYLLVDEAHGAHFGFHESFPQSAVSLGADLVIQSLHKTLPAFTQTAVLHSNIRELDSRIRKYLAIYQSSSPSYLLMAGMDQCVRLLEERSEELFEEYHRRLEQFYQEMNQLQYLRLLRPDVSWQHGIHDFDRSKLTISVRRTGMTGHELHEQLHKQYHLMLEMEAMDYVLAMTSIGDTKEGFARLSSALLSIDRELAKKYTVSASNRQQNQTDTISGVTNAILGFAPPTISLLPGEAWNKPVKIMALENSSGHVSAVFLSLFPPGAPVLAPGEMISAELIDYILLAKRSGITVTGLTGDNKDRIEIIA